MTITRRRVSIATCQKVISVLERHVFGMADGFCWAGNARLAKEAGVSAWTVRQSIKWLAEMKYVSVRYVTCPRGTERRIFLEAERFADMDAALRSLDEPEVRETHFLHWVSEYGEEVWTPGARSVEECREQGKIMLEAMKGNRKWSWRTKRL